MRADCQLPRLLRRKFQCAATKSFATSAAQLASRAQGPMSALPLKADISRVHWDVRSVPKADMLRYSITSSAQPKGAEVVSPRAWTVQSLAFRQASQVFGICGGSAPTRREKSPRG